MPPRILFLLIILLLLKCELMASDSLCVEKIAKTNHHYKHFISLNDKLYALTDKGKLVIWNLNAFDTIANNLNDKGYHFSAIAVDKEKRVFIGTTRGHLFILDTAHLQLKLYLKRKYYIFSIGFNTVNKLFLIIPYAVYQPQEKKTWTAFKNHTTGIIHKQRVKGKWQIADSYLELPDFTFMDSQDRWWICANDGEWGGHIQIFDTRTEAIIDNKFDSINPNGFAPRSAFEDSNRNIFISSEDIICSIAPDRTIRKWKYNFKFERPKMDTATKVSADSVGNIIVSVNRIPIIAPNYYYGPTVFDSQTSLIYASDSRGVFLLQPSDLGIFDVKALLFTPIGFDKGIDEYHIGVSLKEMVLSTKKEILYLSIHGELGYYYKNRLVLFK